MVRLFVCLQSTPPPSAITNAWWCDIDDVILTHGNQLQRNGVKTAFIGKYDVGYSSWVGDNSVSPPLPTKNVLKDTDAIPRH